MALHTTFHSNYLILFHSFVFSALYYKLYEIYNGKISNIMDFGCFVELEGVGGRREGLVHIAQVQQGMIRDLKSVVKRGEKVKVKVISMAGSKIALSMKEVDQNSGEDLLPSRSKQGAAKAAQEFSNPVRPTVSDFSNPVNAGGVDMRRLMDDSENYDRGRGPKKLTEQV